MNEKKKKRSYTEDFKLEAIRLYESTEKSQAEVEQELGMTAGLLSKWISRYRKEGADAFPGKGNLSGHDAEIYPYRAKTSSDRKRGKKVGKPTIL